MVPAKRSRLRTSFFAQDPKTYVRLDRPILPPLLKGRKGERGGKNSGFPLITVMKHDDR